MLSMQRYCASRVSWRTAVTGLVEELARANGSSSLACVNVFRDSKVEVIKMALLLLLLLLLAGGTYKPGAWVYTRSPLLRQHQRQQER